MPRRSPEVKMTTQVELIYLEYEYRLHHGNVPPTSPEAISHSSDMWNMQYNLLPKPKPLENPLNTELASYVVKKPMNKCTPCRSKAYPK